MFLSKNNKAITGFTIIEIVLVLAVASLIFLIVFVALPALQRSQRNEQRKRDMTLIADAINRYKVNNGGRIPESFDDIKGYLMDEIKDPDGSEYSISVSRGVHVGGGHPITKNKYGYNRKDYMNRTQVRIYVGSKCLDEEGYLDQSNVYGLTPMAHIAITFRLENSGTGRESNGTFYCLDAN